MINNINLISSNYALNNPINKKNICNIKLLILIFLNR